MTLTQNVKVTRGAAWRAMAWKEFRENARWALLAMLLLSGGMVYGLRRVTVSAGIDYNNDGQSLASNSFLPTTVFGSAMAAILLGIMQTLPERRPDAWAFLTHRPVSRTWLFAAKAFSGVILYLAAAVLPLLGAAIWVATPGHVPIPFDWRLMLPGSADILAGISYYFAGMLIGVRSARWYGSRLLVLGTAVLTSLAASGLAREFWQALLSIAIGTAIAGTAAWGSFITVGPSQRQPRIARLSLGFSIYCGLYVVGTIVIELASALFGPGDAVDRYSAYYVLSDGAVIRATTEGDQVGIIDSVGNPIDKYKTITDTNALSTLTRNVPELSISVDRKDMARSPATDTYRSIGRYFAPLRDPSGAYGTEAWYYVYRDRELTGYAVRSAVRIGAIGPDSSVAGQGNVAGRFDARTIYPTANWNGRTLLVSPSTAYDPVIEKRRVTTVFQAPNGEVLRDAAVTSLIYQSSDGKSNDRRFIAASTERAIYIVPLAATARPGPAGASMAISVPLSHDPQRYGRVTISAIDDGGYVVRYSPSWSVIASEPGLPDYVERISAAGKPAPELALPPIGVGGREEPLQAVLAISQFPPAAMLVALAWSLATHTFSWHQAISAPLSERLIAVYFLSVIVVITSIAFALTRRYACTRAARIGWTIAVLLLGPAALLTFIATHAWPTRERCLSCGRKRVVTHETCDHCTARFPPPATDGTEILVAQQFN